MSPRPPGPAIAATRLRTRLVRFRTDRELTQAEVVKSLDWSDSKIHRVENGPGRVQTSDLLALLSLYEIDDASERNKMVELARASRMPGISSKYKGQLSTAFTTYLDYEAFADRLYMYETKFIPGPIQNGGYAEAVVTNMLERMSTEQVNALVDARNERATYLLGSRGAPIDFIIDEAAFHRAVGGEDQGLARKYDTMSRVLDHISSLNTVGLAALGETVDPRVNPNISIRVAPFEDGAYPALRGPFVILDFEDPDDETVLYQEHPTGERLLFASNNEVARVRRHLKKLQDSIPGPEQTPEILEYIKSSYRHRLAHFPKKNLSESSQ